MEKVINGISMRLIKEDITELVVDAIVNPANRDLVLGGGVAGRIREKGGSIIQKECDELRNCSLGRAVITTGGNLKAKYVIHAVGPRYNIDPEPEKHLAMAIYNSLKIAEEKKLSSMALPAISTGIFGYPIDEASKIIVKTILDFIYKDAMSLRDITLCLYSANDLKIFEEAFIEQINQ